MSKLEHVAIIMDGNGRWANSRTFSRPRVWGHVRGASVVSDIVEEADDLGIKRLTLFAFSTENWGRPSGEIKILFALLKKYVQKERARILRNNICFKILGDITHLPVDTQKEVLLLEKDSENNTGLKLTFAFDYGGRREIVNAVNKLISSGATKLDEKILSESLGLPVDVDLLIRTGGEKRISNFMLWQLAYSELYFCPTMWPEFTREEFREICESFYKIERRFGGLGMANSLDERSDSIAQNYQQLNS